VSGSTKDGATPGKEMKSSSSAGGQQQPHKSSVSQDQVTGDTLEVVFASKSR
jgi:hypothetical protein